MSKEEILAATRDWVVNPDGSLEVELSVPATGSPGADFDRLVSLLRPGGFVRQTIVSELERHIDLARAQADQAVPVLYVYNRDHLTPTAKDVAYTDRDGRRTTWDRANGGAAGLSGIIMVDVRTPRGRQPIQAYLAK